MTQIHYSNDKPIPLQIAIKQSGDNSTIKILLEKCGGVNHQDSNGHSSLHYAAMYGKPTSKEIISLLFV